MNRLPTRREALGVALAGASLYGQNQPETRQATGVKVGEMTASSAVLWTRRTQAAQRLNSGIVRKGHSPKAFTLKPGEDINALEGVCTGEEGLVRATVEAQSGRDRKQVTEWVEVGPQTDFIHHFRLQGLKPSTEYRYTVETRAARSKREDGPLTGAFRTAPQESQAASVKMALSSCQMYCRQDREDGFWIYEAIQKFNPDFLVSCGDNVYYDSEDPIVNSVATARYHWQRMYSLPTISSCLRSVGTYFQKDDHDAYSDDSWPGRATPKMAPFRFEEGQGVFREQAPLPRSGEPLYRRFRWGSALEVWLPEARDYRSPNDAEDGPAKSIWGAEQKRWLKDSLLASTAGWKIVVNPNPVIGPDHARKNDNHANPAFATEGREFRQWIRDNLAGRVIVMNGDRHWQYHSVDPETGLHEFCCGPASDEHAVPPSRGEDKRYHQFLRIKGGFVALAVNPDEPENHLVVEHRDVRGAVVYRRVFAKPA
ncbi:MAG: alkaline phosphatase D family protein [Bryobacteraceae bacterium]